VSRDSLFKCPSNNFRTGDVMHFKFDRQIDHDKYYQMDNKLLPNEAWSGSHFLTCGTPDYLSNG